MSSNVGEEYYTTIIEIETHAVGLLREVRGVDVPKHVSALLFKAPSSGKQVARTIKRRVGSGAPALSTGGVNDRAATIVREDTMPVNSVKVERTLHQDESFLIPTAVTVYGLVR